MCLLKVKIKIKNYVYVHIKDMLLSNLHRIRIIYADNMHSMRTRTFTCFLLIRPYVLAWLRDQKENRAREWQRSWGYHFQYIIELLKSLIQCNLSCCYVFVSVFICRITCVIIMNANSAKIINNISILYVRLNMLFTYNLNKILKYI